MARLFPRKSTMITYTVMADCGVGEFLWTKDENEECLVGVNVYSLMDVNCIHEDDSDLIMSMALLNQFAQWVKDYMDGQADDIMDSRNIDWDKFNAEGLRLTKMLKCELGDSANMQYVKAWDDPNSKLGEVFFV